MLFLIGALFFCVILSEAKNPESFSMPTTPHHAAHQPITQPPRLFPFPQGKGLGVRFARIVRKARPRFLCHSERSEESRIFLGAKHLDLARGVRSRAAPNPMCSDAKVPYSS